jgi:hypothetical protein
LRREIPERLSIHGIGNYSTEQASESLRGACPYP